MTLDQIVNLNEVIMICFGASWCGPCRKLDPILQELDNENNNLSVIKIDTDLNRELPARFGVRSLPSIFFFKKGNEIPVGTMTGAQPKSNFELKIKQLFV